jgi:hypothetical protein
VPNKYTLKPRSNDQRACACTTQRTKNDEQPPCEHG